MAARSPSSMRRRSGGNETNAITDLSTLNNNVRSPLKKLRNAVQRRHQNIMSRKRSFSAPARMSRKRHLLVEDHYRVDPEDKTLLPGLPVNDEDWARDLHDFFNLVSLVPVVVLNIMNWNWDVLLDPYSKKTLQQAWTGEWFILFYGIVMGYFVADLVWVIAAPRCVKSPSVIIQHHLATIIYLLLPYQYAQVRWLMGACLSVEINTWLLIARRVFNKQGFPPWVIDMPPFFSIRIKLISIFFYITWISIRCLLYPLIMKVLWTSWLTEWEKTGHVLGLPYGPALVLHSIFCVLNFKWTSDLFMSKYRAWKSGNAAKIEKGL
mmetsp:Transcript_1748/g.3366  ORF Transcript_1748/g.3366 Transcript_1748/m.3366 type:complete len:322 (+) Transcript_1748:182-1147(+)